MIAFINGTIDAISTDTITVDHAGMGWEIYYPHVSDVHAGEQIKVYTSLCRSHRVRSFPPTLYRSP